MRNIIFLLVISLFVFSCKKSDVPTELRIKTIKYYFDDSIVGQTDLLYSQETTLLEYESVYLNNTYTRHHYIFQNDSVRIDEAAFNGVDSSYKTYIVNISGSKHLISRIRTLLPGQQNYTYDSQDHLTLANFATDKSFNFTFDNGNVVSYQSRIYNTSTFDTITHTVTYVGRSYQPGINYLPMIQMNGFSNFLTFENFMNLELAGCTFNAQAQLISTDNLRFHNIDNTVQYSYEFDNNGRITSKSYTEPVIAGAHHVKVIYEYL